MAVCSIFDMPGVTQAQYEAVCRDLNHGKLLSSLSDWPLGGILSHTSGPTPGGWRVIDVWETEADFRRFGELIGPLMQRHGFPDVQPQVFPVHNLVNRGVGQA
jgi:hypothetical protein